MGKPSERSMLDAWTGLLFAHSRVIRGLEADMLEQHGLPLTWFDIMSRIRQAPERRLRMRQLEDASVFTRSGMTRLVDRVEAAGYVRRERSPEDRRGVFVAITPAGSDKIDEVWPDHVASIERHFGRPTSSFWSRDGSLPTRGEPTTVPVRSLLRKHPRGLPNECFLSDVSRMPGGCGLPRRRRTRGSKIPLWYKILRPPGDLS